MGKIPDPRLVFVHRTTERLAYEWQVIANRRIEESSADGTGEDGMEP